jgi:hypothetical protein
LTKGLTCFTTPFLVATVLSFVIVLVIILP